MTSQAAFNHWGFLIAGIGLLAVGIRPVWNPRRAKDSFNEVPESQRPAWSYMPPWYHRILGLVAVVAGAVFLFMFFRD